MPIVFPECLNESCHNPSKTRGYCLNHYNYMMKFKLLPKVKPDYSDMICSVEGCETRANAKGMCRSHYNAFSRYGRTEIFVKKGHNKGKSCSIDGCDKPARKTGLCQNHYEMQRKYGRTEKLDNFKTEHPLYRIWVDKLAIGALVDEWNDDFWKFVADVGAKPDGDLVSIERIRSDELYGPSNFIWYSNLQRKDGESEKDWTARKWQSRKENFPDFEIGRHLEREYGLLPEEYLNKLMDQNHVCKICKQPETSMHRRDGKERVKRLAVDHCHETEGVRDLLCTRCNHTLGRVEENLDILQGMIDYLKHWNSILKPPKEPD